MALIKCPDCGKEISDKAKTCIHCGCPIISTTNVTRIQTPSFNQALSVAMKNRECGFLDASTNEVLWRGKVGSIAEFELEHPISIKVHFYWTCFPREIKLGIVNPGKTYLFDENKNGWKIKEVQGIVF